MSCGAGFANRLLQKIELELLAAKKRRLENEAKCWRLTRECLLAIKRLDEAILFLVCKSLEHYGYEIIPNNTKEAKE